MSGGGPSSIKRIVWCDAGCLSVHIFYVPIVFFFYHPQRKERRRLYKACLLYTSSGENRFYLDDEKSGELYGEFIGKELVEFTRKLFPLSDKREDTFIAGLSMGGYGAIRNGLKYAENFGCVIGLSAALVHDTWKDADNSAPIFTFRRSYYEAIFGEYDKVKGSDKDPKALLLKLKEEGRPVPKMYLCCGTEDGLVTANRDFRDFLNENGVDLTYVEGPGKHDWVFWDTYIKKVLDWLPLKDVYKRQTLCCARI